MAATPLQEILELEAQFRAALAAESERLEAEQAAAEAAATTELAALEAELAAVGERLRIAACAEGAERQAVAVAAAERRAVRRSTCSAAQLQTVLRRHLRRLLPEEAP